MVCSLFFSAISKSADLYSFAAAGIVLAMGEVIDASIIFAVLLFNAIVGTIQEGKAQKYTPRFKKIR